MQQLIPLLSDGGVSSQEIFRQTKDAAQPKGFVYDMPRVDVDYEDEEEGQHLFVLDPNAEWGEFRSPTINNGSDFPLNK